MTDDREMWKRIEREAREQALAVMAKDEFTPLEFGRSLAWVECSYGKTDGLSVVHRVGEVLGDSPRALCGAKIPDVLLRLPLSANLVRSLGRCHYCESAYADKGIAA